MSKQGFTLIELLVSITISSIVISIAYYQLMFFNKQFSKANHSIELALESKKVEEFVSYSVSKIKTPKCLLGDIVDSENDYSIKKSARSKFISLVDVEIKCIQWNKELERWQEWENGFPFIVEYKIELANFQSRIKSSGALSVY